ncbi:MAG: methyltransferase domain-containing protein [Anaerolineaceae bacterium]|nr:methyltransferase domain-containing protein [Anaerolineaceae bacterium]
MKESDIRSRDVQDKYLSLCAQDAERLLARRSEFVEIACPACDCPDKDQAFIKEGYRFSTCRECGTLYLGLRPTAAMLAEFNSTSASARYWVSEFYPSCAEKRRRSVYRPRAEYARELEGAYGKRFETLVDVGTGYGVFVEELQKVFPDRRVIGIEPNADFVAVCRDKGLEVFCGLVCEAAEHRRRFDFCSCFEVLEHVFSPLEFLEEVKSILQPGGVFFTNTLCSDGFDIQIMWRKHRNVYPVNHINILSIRGFELLFERAGFAGVHITTPGKLDLDIIRSQMPPEETPRFLQTMYRRNDEEMLRQFQAFLAAHRLSSHAWIVARKTV